MTPVLPSLKPKKVLQALERAGFYVHHTTGSHYILKQPHNPALRITLPFHGRELKRRTLHTIIKQAGLTAEEFREFL